MAEGVQGIGSSTDAKSIDDIQIKRHNDDSSRTASVKPKKPEEDIHTKSRQVAYVNPSGAPGVFGFGFPHGGVQKPKDSAASASCA